MAHMIEHTESCGGKVVLPVAIIHRSRLALVACALLVCRPALAQDQDWASLGRYREASAALNASAPRPLRVVFYGDSITEGWARYGKRALEHASRERTGNVMATVLMPLPDRDFDVTEVAAPWRYPARANLGVASIL